MRRGLRVLLQPVVAALLVSAATARAAEPFGFDVVYDAKVHPGPVNARVYVLLGPASGSKEPRLGPDWFHPQPFFAVDARGWMPGTPLRIDAAAIGFPGPLATLAPGRYKAQAVVRLNPDTHRIGNGEGNAYGPAVAVDLDPARGGVQPLKIDAIVPPRPFAETERLKLVDIPSPMLSAFHKRPIRHRAAVILPKGSPGDGRTYPTLYIIPGFGGDHHLASEYQREGRRAYATGMIRVVLDPDCGTGHHTFADSATNGPRARALVAELIPHIERTFPAVPEPGARLLNGHSSGGWSSLWLQVTHPDVFGGTWSTAPDSVDFRHFQLVDIYAPGSNLFRDPEGKPWPIARRGRTPALFTESFSKMEDVIGDGGQLHSFEAVFSPLGPDGRPRPLTDRATGAVDPEVARAWEAYDLRLILERDWPKLGPKLKGKLHIFMGEIDTFYLDGATRALKESLGRLGGDAVVEIVPGKDHMNLVDADLASRMNREMNDAVVRDTDRGTTR